MATFSRRLLLTYKQKNTRLILKKKNIRLSNDTQFTCIQNIGRNDWDQDCSRPKGVWDFISAERFIVSSHNSSRRTFVNLKKILFHSWSRQIFNGILIIFFKKKSLSFSRKKVMHNQKLKKFITKLIYWDTIIK